MLNLNGSRYSSFHSGPKVWLGRLLFPLLLVSLVACGGGGGDDSSLLDDINENDDDSSLLDNINEGSNDDSLLDIINDGNDDESLLDNINDGDDQSLLDIINDSDDGDSLLDDLNNEDDGLSLLDLINNETNDDDDEDNTGGSGEGSWVPGSFKPESDFVALCQAPRTGNDPFTNEAYPDENGTLLDEKNWLRSWNNNTYLWYNEVTDVDPAPSATAEAYFDLLKTTATTPSGAPKDNFHFTYDTAEWNSLSGSGVSAGYGIAWTLISSLPPRDIRIAYTEPNSPATASGVNLLRGAKVLEINGIDAVSDNTSEGVNILNEALFPSDVGASYEFTVLDAGSDTPRTVTLTAASITSTPVQNVKTVTTESNSVVGYMLFNDHIATSEQQLVNAINQLSTDGATALVLDLRYNGGGLLTIASQLAYMIAGATPTQSSAFYDISFNEKHPDTDPVTGEALEPIPFVDTTVGFSAAAGASLPTLNLERVYVLTGSNTCSASEAIINGLRGVDVEVIQIGGTTCGKPYGFYPTDNCGTTYFTVQFKGNNAKGFGEYSDGFVPVAAGDNGANVTGCSVADDFDHALGDEAEARFAAALAYHETDECPTAGMNGMQKRQGPIVDGYIQKSEGLRNNILLVPNATR